ncbi:MAG: phosphorylcholine metabolism protein LicD [Francisella sp.]|jgi:phosphorylcholine metabolism protein LicD
MFFLKKVVKFIQKKIKIVKIHYRFKCHGADVLIVAKKALDESGVKFWLDFGTLLGYYREKSFIKGDIDIDIGVFLDDYTINIEKNMVKNGFKLINNYIIQDAAGIYGLEQTYVYKKIKLDIFYYSYVSKEILKTHAFIPFEGLNYRRSLKEKNGLRVLEQYLPYNGFDEIEYFGEKFLIPSKTDGYLSYHYGSDFMVPRSWNFMDTEKDNVNAMILKDKTYNIGS